MRLRRSGRITNRQALQAKGPHRPLLATDARNSESGKRGKDGMASELTVGDLASMSSGMKWSEKYYNPINITSESYFTDNLRSVILRQKIVKQIENWKMGNYEPV